MSKQTYVDFVAIKSAVTLEQAIHFLALRLKKSGKQYRGPCPVHAGTDRTLAVTPGEGFFCFADHKGGDVIALVAHCREIGQRDAALLLAEHFRIGSDAERQPAQRRAEPRQNAPQPAAKGLEPLSHLSTDHEALELLGLSPAVCEALGAGFASKGLMNGRIAIPLRLEDGTLIGYAGLATRADQAPLLKLPSNLDEMCGVAEPIEEPQTKSQDELRRLLRVV
jgi:DNA primase